MVIERLENEVEGNKYRSCREENYKSFSSEGVERRFIEREELSLSLAEISNLEAINSVLKLKIEKFEN